MPFLTAALYKFVELPDHAALQAPLLAECEAQGIKGTLLLAAEGINGTIAGLPAGVRAVLSYLRNDPRLAALEHKESWASAMPFYRMKVRLKKEIVTLGVPDVHLALMAGGRRYSTTGRRAVSLSVLLLRRRRSPRSRSNGSR